MATYVNDLRLKEITTGDESGTWGTSTNTNLELIAEAFSYGTEVITTNADTHTTTIADGATDPGRSLYLKYTGTLDSACTITIGPNTVSKVWIIENGTSGSQDIIISQGSGANITIPAGDTKVVYSDGAGAGAAFFDAFASLSVVDLKVQDDLTVTDDASIGGDATITGTLGVTGNITGTLATAAQPNITSVGTLTGFTSTGIDDNADATAITIDSSENVGIGVSSPSGVGGRIVEISSANTISELHITNSTSGSGSATGLTHILNGVDAYAYNRENGAYIFGSNNTERMRIDSSGNVGIGTSSPDQLLQLGSETYAANAIIKTQVDGSDVGDFDAGLHMRSHNDDFGGSIVLESRLATNDIVNFKYHNNSSAGATAMAIDATNGNVGIGTTGPDSKLHIDGNFNGPLVTIHNTGGASAAYAGLEVETSTTGTYVQKWLNAGTELGRFTATGNLLVGATTPTTKLTVSGQGAFGSADGSGNGIYLYVSGTLSDNSYMSRSSAGSGTTTWYIGNQSITTSSDARLKDNIVDSERNAVEIINNLRVVDHTWNDPSDQNVNNKNSRGVWTGLIAQEAVEHIPWLVNRPLEDVDENGYENYWHMDYGYAVPLLIKAIQEQQTQ
jgi:hypothetical protein